ncbi:hypothetical protein N658DRAFT_492215 [Parathielavia hyrcaniae]|uniref:Uncharacterized protein n=1 Tax=Parathielavia hyrcaniae TaxID=113614 RepID=A0AAN6Q8R3_9PEZI|nr:hypothetical protein N658DRAFT_492215 [Parathielavia hyrcaniae]
MLQEGLLVVFVTPVGQGSHPPGSWHPCRLAGAFSISAAAFLSSTADAQRRISLTHPRHPASDRRLHRSRADKPRRCRPPARVGLGTATFRQAASRPTRQVCTERAVLFSHVPTCPPLAETGASFVHPPPSATQLRIVVRLQKNALEPFGRLCHCCTSADE